MMLNKPFNKGDGHAIVDGDRTQVICSSSTTVTMSLVFLSEVAY
jgi:hypothetical protein